MSFPPSLFLPTSPQDLQDRGWQDYDFLYVTGDAYVDHPSFGTAILSRVLEAQGYRVAILAQPRWKTLEDFTQFPRPKLGVLVSAGNIDSMVAHYTTSKKRRHNDCYSPGNRHGLRPDRATIVYCQQVRKAFGHIPLVIGGLEASLRRFAHYDYWEDLVRPSILLDAQADLLLYGMGERSLVEVAEFLRSGTPVSQITQVRGSCFLASRPNLCTYPRVESSTWEEVRQNKKAYAQANRLQYQEHDPYIGKAIVQKHGEQWLVVNPPALPLTTQEFDQVAALPFVREPHPKYQSQGGVPAIEEVRFSVIHNRGCFGACNFCSLAFHQGRVISSRSHHSLVQEVTALSKHPGFKGYIHDVGGPTANFRHPSCEKQKKHGLCKHRECLTPEPCPNLNTDHGDYLQLLRKLRKIPGIKKVFIRSGIRYDYLMLDKSGEFFSDLVQHHVSGQLKVAPEHCVASTLDYMGKPSIEVYEKFRDKYQRLNQRHGLNQFLVPYHISSHPGCTLEDGVALGEWLHKSGHMPQQVQDFYPTPGTQSTCMYHTGIDPRNGSPVYVPKTPKDKALQRALMQWRKPENRPLIFEAIRLTHREDLVGFGKDCLIRPNRPQGGKSGNSPDKSGKYPDKSGKYPDKSGQRSRKPEQRKGKEADQSSGKSSGKSSGHSSSKKAGWATSKPKATKKRTRG